MNCAAPWTLACAVLALAACGAPQADPRRAAAEEACAPTVNRDPVVREYRLKGAGSDLYKYEHEDDLNQALQRALQECLGTGLRGGGVERQRRN